MYKGNHYVSTYQKDYTWPYMSSICHTQPPIKPIVVEACICVDPWQEDKLVQRDGTFEERVNRMCSMGRLVEPKIYPKIERAPVADVSRLDQLTSICLKEGYPDLIEMLEKSLPRETVTRVGADRMKTTYQMDYSDPEISIFLAATRMTQRDMALTVVDKNGQRAQCVPIKITIEADCPPDCRLPSLMHRNCVEEHDRKQKSGKKRESVEKKQISIPAWKSEYQDSISKIGHVIIKAKLHQRKKKALPAVQYQYSTTN